MGKTIAYNPLDYPIYVMAKPVGAMCNLDCSYCYYLEKGELYRGQRSNRMTDEMLEKFTGGIYQLVRLHLKFCLHGTVVKRC